MFGIYKHPPRKKMYFIKKDVLYNIFTLNSLIKFDIYER